MLLLAVPCIRNIYFFWKCSDQKDCKRSTPPQWSSLLSVLIRSVRVDEFFLFRSPAEHHSRVSKWTTLTLRPNIAVDTILPLVNGYSHYQQHPRPWHFVCQKWNQRLTIPEATPPSQVSGMTVAGQSGSSSPCFLFYCFFKIEDFSYTE